MTEPKVKSSEKITVSKPIQETVVPEAPVEIQKEGVAVEGKSNILKRFWYLFLIFGVVIVISLGMFVYGYQKLGQEKPTPTPTPVLTPTPIEEGDEQTSALEEQDTSDEVGDIEADLEATDLSGIDQELEDIDSELSSP